MRWLQKVQHGEKELSGHACFAGCGTAVAVVMSARAKRMEDAFMMYVSWTRWADWLGAYVRW